MANRKRQQKQRLTVREFLVVLVVLWTVGAGLWRYYDLPLPGLLTEEIKTTEKLAAVTLDTRGTYNEK